MAKKWRALRKTAEECSELVVELMKLSTFPDGKHPGRRRSVILSTEDECADVLAAVEYFMKRNKLDIDRVMKRKDLKVKKFAKWWGSITPKKKAKKPVKTKRPRSIAIVATQDNASIS